LENNPKNHAPPAVGNHFSASMAALGRETKVAPHRQWGGDFWIFSKTQIMYLFFSKKTRPTSGREPLFGNGFGGFFTSWKSGSLPLVGRGFLGGKNSMIWVCKKKIQKTRPTAGGEHLLSRRVASP
jgi:hypothetical protein